MKERILDDVPAERLPPSWKFPDVRSAWSERGVPVLSGGDVTTPIELLCGARSFFEFFIDLAEIPDVVEAAMEAIVPHLTARTVRAAEQRGYPAVWVGGWHGAAALPRNVAAIRLAVLQPGRARGRGLGVDRCSLFGFGLDA